MLFFVSFCIFLEANIPFSKSRISFKANLWWVVGCSGVCLLAISVPQRFTRLVESLYCYTECFTARRKRKERFKINLNWICNKLEFHSGYQILFNFLPHCFCLLSIENSDCSIILSRHQKSRVEARF